MTQLKKVGAHSNEFMQLVKCFSFGRKPSAPPKLICLECNGSVLTHIPQYGEQGKLLKSNATLYKQLTLYNFLSDLYWSVVLVLTRGNVTEYSCLTDATQKLYFERQNSGHGLTI